MATLGRITVDVVASMPRCRDCKWWDVNNLITDTERYGTPTEDYEAHLVGKRHCLMTETEDNRPTHDTAAVATDCDGCAAYLATAPTFGCVQFEPRTASLLEESGKVVG